MAGTMQPDGLASCRKWSALMAERGEHPHSAEYQHHNAHDGDDDQDELNHNPEHLVVRGLAQCAPRFLSMPCFLSMRSRAPPPIQRLYRRGKAAEIREAVKQLRIVG